MRLLQQGSLAVKNGKHIKCSTDDFAQSTIATRLVHVVKYTLLIHLVMRPVTASFILKL
jgi:hypothetical protein